ncbi:MAG: transposase [Cyanobacteria bacterium P01_A01_bin.45]
MRKLTDSDKKEILKLYRESAETTSTLAERYSVSNSTISRLLKSTLPEDEYEYLVSLKRAARTPEGRAQVNYKKVPDFVEDQDKLETEEKSESLEESPEKSPKKSPEKSPEKEKSPAKISSETSKNRRVRRRSSAASEEVNKPAAKQLELLEAKIPEEIEEEIREEIEEIQAARKVPGPILKESRKVISTPILSEDDEEPDTKFVAEMFGEELDEDDDLDDLDDEYYDEDDEDDDWQEKPIVRRVLSADQLVRVMPLSAANLPRTCYVVIDRAAELITRPLEDFGDLGEIPNLETQQRTLPVFDNHRVAKRFSSKRDRVIKVPDSQMLQKAREHLEAKGITRLLIDGRVYSLSLN